MRFKKIILLTIILVTLFAVSTASAAENVTNDVIGVEETTDDISVQNNDSIISQENNVCTFDDLSSKISATPEGGLLNLTKNYTYVNGSTDGIIISKTITINGQGHTIDGNKISRIFNISSNNVTLKNINFLNSKTKNDNGGAIYWSGANGSISECTFMDNRDIDDWSEGGAIYWSGTNGNVDKCNFSNCYANECGGAISWHSNNGSISNSNFIENTVNGGGGAIYFEGNNFLISNCSFIKNTANLGGSICNWFSVNSSVLNSSFVNNHAHDNIEYELYGNPQNDYYIDPGKASSIYWGSDGGSISNCTFINNTHSSNGVVYWIGENGSISNCIFINNSAHSDDVGSNGGAIYWSGYNGTIFECCFINNTANSGGAIILSSRYLSISNCTYIKNTANSGGAIYYFFAPNGPISNCTFIKNTANKGGAIYVESKNGTIFECCFINNTANNGGAIYWSGNNGTIFECCFINNVANENGTTIYIVGNNENITNCTFINDRTFQIFWNNENGNIITCKFLNNTLNNVFINHENSNVNFIKRNILLIGSNYEFFYKNPKTISVNLINILDNPPIYSNILFVFNQSNDTKKFVTKLNNTVASIFEELTELNVGNWTVNIIFEGDDNYNPCNLTTTLTVLSRSTSLTINDATITKGHKISLFANVSSDLIVNEGTVTFFDGSTQIGESPVSDGVANLTYAPTTAGEHNITAIFNSINYLSSNGTSKLLVDSATVDVLVNQGIVGFNSNFVAEVKGLYSTINEGTIAFYINDEHLGSVPVVSGLVSISYVPLNAKTYTVKAIYTDSNNLLNGENSTLYNVVPADSMITIGDINGTVGHDIVISVNITSSNNLTVNEGIVTFFDGSAQIGESPVSDGVANLTYAPTTAGKHKITSVYSACNYQSSNSSYDIIVNKASTELIFNDIVAVEYQTASSFIVNIKSDSNIIQEGKIKFYINGSEIKYQSVTNGLVVFDYVSPDVGTFDIVAIFEETDNYLASNATSTFTVEKLSTTISASAVTTVYNSGKYLVATLTDSQSNPINGVTVTIKLSNGKTATPTTDKNGHIKFLTNGLAPKTYTVTISFDGNTKYDKSTKSVKVTVKKATPKLTAKAKTFKKSVKTKKYTVTLKTNQNKFMKNTKVTIKVNKKTYTTKTNSKGVATFKLTQLTKKGKYTAVVKYIGNKYYNAKTVKSKIIVK